MRGGVRGHLPPPTRDTPLPPVVGRILGAASPTPFSDVTVIFLGILLPLSGKFSVRCRGPARSCVLSAPPPPLLLGTMPSWAIAPPLLLSLCLPCWLAVSPLVTPQGCHNFSENLPLPSNLTVTIKGIGSFNYMWKWRPPTDLQNYTQHPFRYDSSLKYDGGKWERRKISPSLKREEIVQLNQGISFRVKALVEVGALTCRESDWVKNYIPPEEGENESAVTNFKCVYYNFEYLNCTWSFGRRTPPDTIYSFHYWQENMDRIQNCSNYIRKDGRHVGCQLRHDQFSDKYDLNSQVKGLSDVMKIKPFYHKTEMVAFVKLRPPWGIIVTRIPPGFHVTWEVPKDWKPHCLKYQVRIQSCKRNLWVLYNFTDQEANITDADKDSKNTIQVRAKYDICGSSGIWSEWSPAKYFGEDTRKAWNLGIALLIVIPVLIAAAVIIFLIKLKKLQKLILPPIPDPGKLLKDMIESSNADYSMKNKYLKRSLTLKPELELTCKVTTVEQMMYPAESERKLNTNEVLEEDEEAPMDDDYMQYNLVTS